MRASQYMTRYLRPADHRRSASGRPQGAPPAVLWPRLGAPARALGRRRPRPRLARQTATPSGNGLLPLLPLPSPAPPTLRRRSPSSSPRSRAARFARRARQENNHALCSSTDFPICAQQPPIPPPPSAGASPASAPWTRGRPSPRGTTPTSMPTGARIPAIPPRRRSSGKVLRRRAASCRESCGTPSASHSGARLVRSGKM